MVRVLSGLFCALALFLPAAAWSQSPTFDLPGPAVTVTVARGDVSVPIGQVPGLRAGDRLTLRAQLPEDQSARYLLVVAFLRGATNPPPDKWFSHVETWKRKKNTLTVTVPEGAEQAIAFLAPDAGGGLDAIEDAVRGRPGVFVRAAQDLNQASLDRVRLEAFVAGIAKAEAEGPGRVAAVSPVLAQTLAIRLNAQCLVRPREVQAACLTENRETLVLQTGRTQTWTETLTGTPTDLAYRIAATPEGGAGFYSPYIGLARDLARLFGAFRSAQYQYIPALAVAQGDTMRLQLNTAPSFQNPRSVLVAPLPPIGDMPPPALRQMAKGALCVTRPDFVLPVEDAPLVYATQFAHDLALRIKGADGVQVDVPLVADAERGGLALRQGARIPAAITEAALVGRWGFSFLQGPRIALQTGGSAAWTPASADVVVGREQPLTLRGGGEACVERIGLRDAEGNVQPLTWKAGGAGEVAVTLPLAKTRPGALTLLVSHYGAATPMAVALTARAERSRLDLLVLHEGDRTAVLTGARLDQVAEVALGDARFAAGALSRGGEGDRLMLASPTAPTGLTPGKAARADVRLRDGRKAEVSVTIAPARPQVALVSRNVETAAGGSVPLTLPDTLMPQEGRLTFSIRGANGAIAAADVVEIAPADGKVLRLSAADGTLQIVGGVAVASFEPRAALGPAAAGPIRFRLVRGDVASDWQPLTQVVRLPKVDAVTCPATGGECSLAGERLFVVAAVADTPDFARATQVPAGFVGREIMLPRPAGDRLYLRLHDAPQAAVSLPVR